MKTRTLIALAVIAGFAATAQAGGDKTSGASSKPSTSASAGSSASGADKAFQALDKNHDGFVTRAEMKGSPQEKDFTALDKNRDGKLTPAELAAAPASSSAASGSSKPKY
jgi:Ca2+-binding EF-hand superfamily protein